MYICNKNSRWYNSMLAEGNGKCYMANSLHAIAGWRQLLFDLEVVSVNIGPCLCAIRRFEVHPDTEFGSK